MTVNEFLTNQPAICRCVGCGCSDLDACFDPSERGPCRWLRVDRASRQGVCSCCPEVVAGWDLAASRGPIREPLSRRVMRRLSRLWGIRHARYWLLRRRLELLFSKYGGPSYFFHPADVAYLEAVWKGEA